MRLCVLTFFAASLVLATSGTAAADHLDKCLGKWKLVKAERDGTPLPKEDFDNNITLVCSKGEGDTIKLVVKKGDEVVTEATIKHVKKGEKYDQYDITYTKGFHKKESLKGKTHHGIIKVDGDTMTVCWHDGKDYPKDFTPAKDAGCTVRTYQKVKD